MISLCEIISKLTFDKLSHNNIIIQSQYNIILRTKLSCNVRICQNYTILIFILVS